MARLSLLLLVYAGLMFIVFLLSTSAKHMLTTKRSWLTSFFICFQKAQHSSSCELKQEVQAH